MLLKNEKIVHWEGQKKPSAFIKSNKNVKDLVNHVEGK